MKNAMISMLVVIAGWNVNALAETKLSCFYRAVLNNGQVSDVILKFSQDQRGRPTGGSLKVLHGNGSTQNVQIYANEISVMSVSPGDGVELIANVHVRSYDVDLVLNYQGNEFSYDASEWLGRRLPNTYDMVTAYREMSEAGAIQHRTDGWTETMQQMTGSVRWNGGLSKIASSKLVCSAQW